MKSFVSTLLITGLLSLNAQAIQTNHNCSEDSSNDLLKSPTITLEFSRSCLTQTEFFYVPHENEPLAHTASAKASCIWVATSVASVGASVVLSLLLKSEEVAPIIEKYEASGEIGPELRSVMDSIIQAVSEKGDKISDEEVLIALNKTYQQF